MVAHTVHVPVTARSRLTFVSQDKFRKCEQLGVEASHEMQQAAKRVLEENQRLRAFLRSKGIDERELDNYRAAESGNGPTDSKTPSPAQGLESLIGRRRPCCSSEEAARGNCVEPVRQASLPNDPASTGHTVAAASMTLPSQAVPANSDRGPLIHSQASSLSPVSPQSTQSLVPALAAAPIPHEMAPYPAPTLFPVDFQAMHAVANAPSQVQQMPVSYKSTQTTVYDGQLQQAYAVLDRGQMPLPQYTGQLQAHSPSGTFFGEQFDSSDLLSSTTQDQLMRGLQPTDEEYAEGGSMEAGMQWTQGDGHGTWHSTESRPF